MIAPALAATARIEWRCHKANYLGDNQIIVKFWVTVDAELQILSRSEIWKGKDTRVWAQLSQ